MPGGPDARQRAPGTRAAASPRLEPPPGAPRPPLPAAARPEPRPSAQHPALCPGITDSAARIPRPHPAPSAGVCAAGHATRPSPCAAGTEGARSVPGAAGRRGAGGRAGRPRSHLHIETLLRSADGGARDPEPGLQERRPRATRDPRPSSRAQGEQDHSGPRSADARAPRAPSPTPRPRLLSANSRWEGARRSAAPAAAGPRSAARERRGRVSGGPRSPSPAEPARPRRVRPAPCTPRPAPPPAPRKGRRSRLLAAASRSLPAALPPNVHP